MALHDASTIAAVIVEPVAGSIGVYPPPVGYLQRLRAITEKHGILLIFDEVITAYGRLGTSSAAEYFGVIPDLVTTAKGLTSGTVPMGAVMARKHVHDAIVHGDGAGPEKAIELFHGYTYSAHPLACAAALATLETYREERLFERAKELAPYWEERLHSLRDRPQRDRHPQYRPDGCGRPEPAAGQARRARLRRHAPGLREGRDAPDHRRHDRHVAAADRDREQIDEMVGLLGEVLDELGLGRTRRITSCSASAIRRARSMAIRRRWWILAAMALPAFLLNIDFYGITVALPSIGEAFGAGTTALQWTVNGFNLALIAPLVAFGRLGDLVGRRRLLLVGVVLFALGSAMCGLASDMGLLIAGRCVQGLAVALFSTSPLSIVGDVFPEDRRGLAFSIWAAIGAAGSAVGPLVGGALTDLLGWRWFFFINLPVAALTIVLVLAIVPESRDETARGPLTAGLRDDHPGPRSAGLRAPGRRRPRLDRAGGPGRAAVRRASCSRWPHGSRSPQRAAADRARPVPSARLSAVLGVAIAGNFGFSAVIFFSALYLQDQLDLAPLQAGLVMIAFSACFVVTLPLAGGLLQRAGPRLLMVIGMALMTAACLLFLPGGLHWLVLGLAVAGIGQGFAFNTSTTAAMDAVPAAKSGEASGVLNAARQLGSTLGIAVAGAVFQTIESRGLLAALHGHADLDSAAGGAGPRALLRLGGRPWPPGEPGTGAPGRDRGRRDGRVRRRVPRRDAALRCRLAGGGARRRSACRDLGSRSAAR